jgi:phosphoserine phosphatase RsbU/P
MADLSHISARQISLVLDVSRALAMIQDLERLLRQIIDSTTQLLDCRRASIWLHDPKRRVLRTRVATMEPELMVPDKSGIVGSTLTKNLVINVPNAYDDPRFDRNSDRRTHFRTRNLLSAPMVDLAGSPVGVLQALNKKHGPFGGSDEALIGLLADQAAVAIQRQRLFEEATEAAGLRREMSVARRVQQALLPSVLPRVRGFDCAAWTATASLTGGDCYDLWGTRDGRMAVLLADASSHGIGPAIIVSQVRSMVRLLVDRIGAPVQILDAINARLAADLTPGTYVTAILAIVGSDGQIEWASAGHGPSLLMSRPGGKIRELGGTSLPLGILPDPKVEPTAPESLQMDPGGALMLLSDGVFEAVSSQGKRFGLSPAERALRETTRQKPQVAVDRLARLVERWRGDSQAADDQTIVIVSRLLPLGRVMPVQRLPKRSDS